jgi:hypothetical protein
MLPERSITSDTAERDRATVFALILIVKFAQFRHTPVTLPPLYPGFVEARGHCERRPGRFGSAITVTDVLKGARTHRSVRLI